MAELEEQAPSAGRRHIIERPRLTRLLDETSASVIMLVAPAGYGKTTLARQWLANHPHAWYGANSAPTDVAALGLGLINAGQSAGVEIGDHFREWLHTRRGSEDPKLAADLLADDFQQWPDGNWVAVDDYHRLSASAEALVQRLREARNLRLLLTTRRRPYWSTSRDVLYGDTCELDAKALAMTDVEADRILGRFDADAARGLAAGAQGWPAIIGLVSFAEKSLRPDSTALPPALHAYIAEELYESVDPVARRDLAQLGLLTSPAVGQIQKLLGAARSDFVVAEGLRVGFLADEGDGALSIHPLLRSFLRRKLLELPQQAARDLAAQVAVLLIDERAWDNAFELIEGFNLDELLEPLVEASLYDLLGDGLLSTLAKFVTFGRSSSSLLPILELADAELTFRDGFHERSRVLAEAAGGQLLRQPRLASRAFARAGHGAYFCDDLGAAVANFEKARQLADDHLDERAALWGLFLSAVELEDSGADGLLDEFEKLGSANQEDLLRIQNGRLHFGMRLGDVTRGLAGAEAVAAVVDRARDPVVRTSFWHVYAGALRVAAEYAKALEASDRALREIETFDLSFARAHVYLTRAGVYAGLGAYADALVHLSKARRIGDQNGDVYLQMNERTLSCRVYLLQGDFERAERAIESSWAHVASSGQCAEFMACKALIRGVSGSPEDARALLADAERTSKENEASSLCACVRALLALRDERSRVEGNAVKGLLRAAERRIWDPLIFAFCVDARLAQAATAEPTLRPVLDRLNQTHGAHRRDAVGSRRSLGDGEGLTPREREVFSLIGEGRTNREIGERLFVTESTVKVHVRHILAKLGVRTRTEAAIVAVKMQLRGGVAPQTGPGPELPDLPP
jgi:ATP/maltotriose-dependent transcriptional regulator MalT